MERVNKILSRAEFTGVMERIKAAERGRIYCLHGLEHAVDTARICYIINLEESAGIKKDVIYAAALLHDTGRACQYEDGTPHQEASVAFAAELLPKCGFSAEETAEIAAAIDTHRGGAARNRLGELLRRADDLSRLCFDCDARATCKWSAEEMNMRIVY